MEILLSKLVFWHWLSFALILIILDVAIGANFLFIWCGASAALVGLIMLVFPLTWEYQLLVFGLGVMASLILWRKIRKSMPKDNITLNQRSFQYVGRVFTLEEAIVNGRGKVRVDDTVWIVAGDDMPVGEKVKVVAVDGVILKVTKL
jgi:membrane protein implicated in regulation of membrane protease activity